MSFDLIEYYKALNGESSLANGTWHVNYDKRHAFSVYSDMEGYENVSLIAIEDIDLLSPPFTMGPRSMYLSPSNESTESISIFSDKSGQKLNNTKIIIDENGNETVELELADRIVTIIMDQSGSMTWNDNNKFRHGVAKDLIEKIDINYPGDIRYNLIDYGAKFINILLFGVVEEEGINPYDINSLNAMFQADENANYDGIRVVRNTEAYPTSPLDGDIIKDGFVNRILDSDLIEGQTYYYTVYTYDNLGRFSDGVNIKVIPRDRIVPRGISIFRTIVETEDLSLGQPFIGTGVNKDGNTIGIWHMDEGKGTYIYDFSQNGMVLSINNEEPVWYESRFVPSGSSGLFFDGNKNIASAADPNNNLGIAFSGFDNSLSIGLWVYPYDIESSIFVSRDNGTIYNYMFLTNISGKLACQLGDRSVVCSTLAIEAYKWQYIAIIYDGGDDVIFYHNGISETVSLGGAITFTPSSSYSIHMGSNGVDNESFRGRMTEVSIHNILRDSSYISSQLVDNPIFDGDGNEIDTETIGLKGDNGDRLVVLDYEIPDDYNFINGEVIVVKNEKHIPSWEEDGTIIYQETASSGRVFISDPDNFVLGENYYYRIFSKNSYGNISFLSDSPSLEVFIPESLIDDYFITLSSAISSPEEPAIGELITSGNEKIYLRWKQATPLDSRIARVKIYYSSSLNPPIVSKNGGNSSQLIFTGLPTEEKFIHRNLTNDIPASYTIVNVDKYGRASNYNPDGTQDVNFLQASATPTSTAIENTIPLLDVNNLNYELRDNNSITIGWDQPIKSPENIDAYFDQTILIYASLTDEFGDMLPQYASIKMYIDSNIVRETHADDVFNSVELSEFSDIDAYDFFVTRTDQGFLKATLRMTTNSRIMSQIKNATFTIQLKSYIPKEGGYNSPNIDTNSTLPLVEYADLISSSTNDVEDNEDKNGENVFEYFSKLFTVHFTNPWEITLEPKYENQRVYERCYYQVTDPITKEKSLAIDNEAFYGVPMRSSSPFVARAKVSYKGLPVENTSLQIAVWDADSSNLCVGAGGDSIWGIEGEKLQLSQIILPPDNTLSIIQGTEEQPGASGDPVEVPISYVDIPLYAPDMPQAVRLFVKGEQSGYSSIKDIYILFQNILRIEITASKPNEDGIDIREQFSNVFVINPDYPDLTDPYSYSLATPVADLTIVQWDIKKIRGENNRTIYSTDNVSVINGVYSYARNGMARNVFMGPIQIDSESFDETHEISATVVYGGLTAQAKSYINLYYDPVESTRFGARFLMEIDGGWRFEGTSKVSFGGGGWMAPEGGGNPLWADGSHYKRIKIHRNPVSTPEFAATGSFNTCASEDDSQVFELNSGQIVNIVTGDNEIEILHGDITEDVDPYTGNHYLLVGEEGFIDNGSAFIELNNEEDSDITYFYIRANKFIPGSGDISTNYLIDDEPINECLELHPNNKGLFLKDLPKWSPYFTVSGTTTLFVNNQPLVLKGGGDFYTGMPPCPICLSEPLIMNVVWRKVTNYFYSETLGDPLDEYLYPVVVLADTNLFKDDDGETLINHDSYIDIRVKIIWKGGALPNGTPIYISIGDNTSSTIFMSNQNIYYTQIDEIEEYSYADIRLAARTIPSSTVTESLEIYSVYDENGKTERHVGTNFSLTLNIKDIIVDTPALPEEDDPSVGDITIQPPRPFTSIVHKYDIDNNIWSILPSMSESRGNFFIGEVNGKIYVMGGLMNNSLNISSSTEEYDIVANMWQDKMIMPTSCFGGMSVTIGNDIYTIGGIINDPTTGGNLSVTNSVQVYHTDTDLWEDLEIMPTINFGGAFEERLCVAFGAAQHVILGSNNYIYIIGGIKDIITSSSFSIEAYNERILRYHVENDSWEYSGILRSNELNTYRRISPLTLIYNNKIIVFNGAIESGGNFTYPSDDFYINIQDIFTDTPIDDLWINFGSGLFDKFPVAKFQSAMIRYDDNPSVDTISEYYIIGGGNNAATSLDILEKLSATSDGLNYENSYDNDISARLSSLLTARHGAGAVYSDIGGVSSIYLIGGYTIAQDESFMDITFDI